MERMRPQHHAVGRLRGAARREELRRSGSPAASAGILDSLANQELKVKVELIDEGRRASKGFRRSRTGSRSV
jgi:hypothetical protein